MQAIENLTGIAIIGMACRFPQAADLDAFWDMLVNGREATQCFSDEELLAAGVSPEMLRHPDYVKKGLLVPDVDCFDAHFFNMSEHDAEICDPQRRLFLECAYTALEHAGYPPTTHSIRTGIYAGIGDNHYLEYYLQPHIQELLSSVGYYRLSIMNSKDFIATDAAYRLNLKGPAVTVLTACSTSLVAVHTACQSLLNFECDQALAGAVSIALPHKQGYLYQAGMILSPDGHCRAFDADANGTMVSGGVGIVVLKRLEDALADQDTIYAVIRGSAINNDGADKIGFTAPSVTGQVNVILEALAAADTEPDEINYIEAHGTGTPLGDPIEIQALTQAFRIASTQNAYCAIGSVKTNIGHADTAAGIAGLIKTVLALQHEILPASLHFKKPNPQIDFADSPFFVNNVQKAWKTDNGKPRCAGISSFGIGGTNAHVIVQEAPSMKREYSGRAVHLLLLSAKTAAALNQACCNLGNHLQRNMQQNLTDVSYTLQHCRETFSHRRILVCKNHEEAIQQLLETAPVGLTHTIAEKRSPRIAFLLPGQGSQYAGMTRDLNVNEMTFRNTVDQCATILQGYLNKDIRDELFKLDETSALNQTSLTQSALFVVEYALAKLWMSWGIQPSALLGHSIGEYVAACLSGVFSLEEALLLVSTRGRLIQALPPGEMFAVPLSEAEAGQWCSENISLAVINGSKSCVLAGSPEMMTKLQLELHEQGIESRKLSTSHAFHSSMMEAVLEEFAICLQGIHFQPPQIPYLSNVSGDWINAEEATNPAYWIKHLRHTVRFADNVEKLLQNMDILLEVGPGRVLTSLVRQHPGCQDNCVTLHTMPQGQETIPLAETGQLLKTLGQLWLHGAEIDWEQVYGNEPLHRVPLPSYPFQRQRYWFERPKETDNTISYQSRKKRAESESLITPDVAYSVDSIAVTQTEAEIIAIWQQSIGKTKIGLNDKLFEMGADSLMAVHIVSRLNQHFQSNLSANDLLGNPTVKEVAALIGQNTTNDTDDLSFFKSSQFYPLIQLQKGNKHQEPLFLVHPAGGNLFVYKDLIKYIDDEQSVFGFEALGLQDDDKVEQSIEEMASTYIEALIRFKPEGDYQLGGSSSGGVVAFEMAHQLRQRGKQVAFLGLFDTPMGSDLPMETNNKLSVIEYFASLFAERDYLLQAMQNIANVEQKSDWLFEQLKQGKELPDSMDIYYWRRLINVFVANINALLTYKPAPYPGRLVYFRAQERRLEYDPQYPELPWLDLSDGGVTVHVVPGDHQSMFVEPHVNQLLAKLIPYLLGERNVKLQVKLNEEV